MYSSSAIEFSRLAPVGLLPPNWLLEAVRGTSRPEYINAHGFTAAQLGPNWWIKRGIELDLKKRADGGLGLTRGDLFRMSDSVDDDESLLSFLWHVLAWGSGLSRRNNDLRIDSCRRHTSLLRDAFNAARESDTRAAYGHLIRPGGAMIPQLGPAFFSKFLYFASEGAHTRCLILDARVAQSLWALGWSIAPTNPSRFSYNWYTDTYVSYCQLLAAWAAASDGEFSADMFERALFEGPAH